MRRAEDRHADDDEESQSLLLSSHLGGGGGATAGATAARSDTFVIPMGASQQQQQQAPQQANGPSGSSAAVASAAPAAAHAAPSSHQPPQQQQPLAAQLPPCLESALSSATSSSSSSSSNSSTSGKDNHNGGSSGTNKEQGICRICLEEDCATNMEMPCGCAGTQRFAHHACIQRWVEEKGHLRCEVCEQQYKGQYVVPPPPPPAADALPLFAPMYIHVGAEDGPHGRALDYLDDSDTYYNRNPGLSWCFTFVIFVMFLVVLHHTMIAANGAAYDDSTSGGASAGGSEAGVDEYATSLTLFLLWVGTKAFLIGIPLYTVMKIAARQARREQYEAMIRAGAYDATARRMVLRVRALRTAAARNAAVSAGTLGPNAV